jgi:hypothetical protein
MTKTSRSFQLVVVFIFHLFICLSDHVLSIHLQIPTFFLNFVLVFVFYLFILASVFVVCLYHIIGWEKERRGSFEGGLAAKGSRMQMEGVCPPVPRRSKGSEVWLGRSLLGSAIAVFGGPTCRTTFFPFTCRYPLFFFSFVLVFVFL